MRAKEFMSEIDYSPGLQELSISDQHLIAKSKIAGEIDGQDVHLYKDGNQECYFLVRDEGVEALILVLHQRLRAIRNFTGAPGAVTALVAFYTHVLRNKLVIDHTEQLTDSGIKWLCSLIRAGGRGLKLTDQTGKYPNADMLYFEWEKAMADENGPTSIIIESNIKRVLYNRGDLLMIPTRWIGESYETYERVHQMRAKEFIVEYNRQMTANQVGDKLIQSLIHDQGLLGDEVPASLRVFRNKMRTMKNATPEQINTVITPEDKTNLVNDILTAIEAHDPTANKQYTPWLARMYAKSGGGLWLENINRMDLIGLFDLAKKRRIVKPEHADINRFKWYQDFEDEMETHYNFFDELEAESMPEGKATKPYEDDTVLVVVPEDEAASCKYGRNTRWCTAATKGFNRFEEYNRTGKLYILIPKQPVYDGEKYQLHFQSSQYMNEDDEPVTLSEIFKRFPNLKDFFVQSEPDLKSTIMFAPDEELQQAIESVAEMVEERIWDEITDWQFKDDYYYQYLRDEGYVDEEGDIDWDKVEEAGLTYEDYDPGVKRWSRDIMNTVKCSPQELRDIMEDDPYTYAIYEKMTRLPDAIGTMLREKYIGRRDEGDANIGQWLVEKVAIKREGDKWQAYVVGR